MRIGYFIHKFLGGVIIGLVCGGIAVLLLMLVAVICYSVLV